MSRAGSPSGNAVYMIGTHLSTEFTGNAVLEAQMPSLVVQHNVEQRTMHNYLAVIVDES